MESNNRQRKTGMLIKIAYRNIYRNKRRTAFSLCAVGVAVFMFVFVTSFNDGQVKCVSDTVQVFEEGHVKVVSARYEADNNYMPVQYPLASGPENPNGKNWKEIAATIRKIPGVREVFPRISSLATMQQSSINHAVLWGLDIPGEMKTNHFNLADRNDGLRQGRWPTPNSNECAVGEIFARKTGLGIGDHIPLKTVSAQFSDKMWSPVITGIFNFDYFKCDERYIIVDFERLQRLLVLDEGTQSLVIFADNQRRSGSIAAAVQKLMGEDHVVSDWNKSHWIAIVRANTPIYIVVYLIFLIVASFLIINTIMMIIHERIKEIGMMGCLGMTRAEIIQVFFFESVFLAIIGASLGVIAGGTLTGILSIFPLRLGKIAGNVLPDFPISSTIFFRFGIARMAQAWLTGLALTSLFTLFPSLRSAYVEPVEALRR